MNNQTNDNKNIPQIKIFYNKNHISPDELANLWIRNNYDSIMYPSIKSNENGDVIIKYNITPENASKIIN